MRGGFLLTAPNPFNALTFRDVEIDPRGAVIHCHGHARADHAHSTHNQHPLECGRVLPDQCGMRSRATGIIADNRHLWLNDPLIATIQHCRFAGRECHQQKWKKPFHTSILDLSSAIGKNLR